MTPTETRRAFFTIAGASALLAACGGGERATKDPEEAARSGDKEKGKDKDDDKDEGDVSAVEDLMREHGVIRRALVVYRESAILLRSKPTAVAPDTLQNTAKLLRSFGEDYHEKLLEEAHIFPAVKKAGGAAASEIDTLIAQHQRGREITDYVLAVTAKAIGAASAEPLAKTLEAFTRMYEEHASREDTIVFQAWKKALSPKELDEMGEKFEDIEHQTFGKDGFDDAVDQIAGIERAMGLDPAALTAPPPPPPPKA
jgi:hemerythrin-like domain-containing protein